MSYKESYLVPKSDFHRLLKGKAVSEASAPARRDVRKRRSEEDDGPSTVKRRAKRDVTPKKKNRGKRDVVPKKKQRGKRDVRPKKRSKRSSLPDFSLPDNIMSPLPLPALLGDVTPAEPGRSKNHRGAVTDFFAPPKKHKQMKLMKFLKDHEGVISVGEDFTISVGGKRVPGSDYIDIVHYLMTPESKRDASFFPSEDKTTNMPTGTKRFVDGLHRAITGKPIDVDMSASERMKFLSKLNNFAGLSLDGVEKAIEGMKLDRANELRDVEEDNIDYTACVEADRELEKEERERAEDVLNDIEEEERIVNEDKGARMMVGEAIKKMRRNKNKGYILKRLLADWHSDAGESETDEEVEEGDVDYGAAVAEKERQDEREHIRRLKTVAERVRDAEATRGLLSKYHLDPATRLLGEYRAARKTRSRDDIFDEDFLARTSKATAAGVRRATKMGAKGMEKEMELISMPRKPTVGEILKGEPLSGLFAEEGDKIQDDEDGDGDDDDASSEGEVPGEGEGGE